MLGMESKNTAEKPLQNDPELLLARVMQQGYIGNYSGVRIDSLGKRFMIKKAVVFNLINTEGEIRGQRTACGLCLVSFGEVEDIMS